MPRPGDPYPKGNKKVRTLTNNPTRNDRPGYKTQVRNQGESKRSIRRLIKRNPSDGLSQPSADKITTTNMASNQPTRARTINKSDKMPVSNKGKEVIRPARIPLGKRLKQGQ